MTLLIGSFKMKKADIYSRLKAMLILTIVIVLSRSAFCQDEKGATNRARLTPDATQRDPNGRYAGDGKSYCGPCAASNALMWLGATGYERLVPNAQNQQTAQYKLVTLLASPRYMKTAEKNSTSPERLMKGIKEYVEDCGYKTKKLETINFKPSEVEKGGCIGEPADSFKKGLKPNSAAIIHIGWYKYDTEKDQYTRFNGHYVTVVGFGKNRQEQPDNSIVIVHDPWNGKSNDYVKLEKLTSGQLVIKKDEETKLHSLKGAYNLTGEMCIYEKADVGLLDHIHTVELAEPQKSCATTRKTSVKYLTSDSKTTINTDKISYKPNEPIVIVLANAPGKTYDWLAIYEADSRLDQSHNYIAKKYTSSKKYGKVTFPKGIAKVSKYQVRLFKNDSLDLLAVCNFTVADN